MGGYNQGSQIKKKLLKREGALKKLRPKFN
jgi:hypothetical protein